MRAETKTRVQITALLFSMTNAVLFGAGVITVLTVPALSAQAGYGIAVVVALSFALAAPIAWFMAPRLRARYWRQRQAREAYRLPPPSAHRA